MQKAKVKIESPFDCRYRFSHGGCKGKIETVCQMPVENKPKTCPEPFEWPKKCPLHQGVNMELGK